ncbi:hypothetical protein UFOVP1290_590 [uncultured Caudovirales phage]|uniref:Uncharacterized protein n=1 Tax=uncultured Caudovirales phage TaxID=2100421 RepID=A0A6J5RHW4_9CAUD|nr:hypothetical protein UFOVP1290_590 [uncultured Caudovirales phage]
MADSDIAVGVTAQLPAMGAINKKPSYLIILENGKSFKKFITLDKPELLNGFLQVKGIYSDSSEDEIIKSFSDILTNSPKEFILDVMLPWHKICSVRSLVFRAK